MFSWRESKRQSVIIEHKVDFALIADVFDDPFAVYIEDFEHSTEEETRFNIIGVNVHYGLIFAAYTYTEADGIHFITARRAENWMVKEYEENRKRL